MTFLQTAPLLLLGTMGMAASIGCQPARQQPAGSPPASDRRAAHDRADSIAAGRRAETTGDANSPAPPDSAGSAERKQVDVDKQLDRAVATGLAWLFAAQQEDGLWHSQTYGALRQGPSLTALALDTIGHFAARDWRSHEVNLKRAYRVLRESIRTRGYVAAADGSLAYPTYATALTLTASQRLPLGATADEQRRMVTYLLHVQLDDRHGFPPGDPDHGGWDLLGPTRAAGITSATNVSVTAFVLEALCYGDQSEDDNVKLAFERAQSWTRRCWNRPGDGGFFFHPRREHDGNKALWKDRQHRNPRSYGTATCDALRCLLATGLAPDLESVAAGIAWLAEQPDHTQVPGFSQVPQLDWHRGLRFYYWASLSRLLCYFPSPQQAAIRRQLTRELLDRQRGDGRWQNESARMREDDPIIATSLALVALSYLRTPCRSAQTQLTDPPGLP